MLSLFFRLLVVAMGTGTSMFLLDKTRSIVRFSVRALPTSERILWRAVAGER